MTERADYAILVCEGRRCVAVFRFGDDEMTEADAVARLAEVAARLRALRALGRVVLVEGRSGQRIASARVGPRVRRVRP